MENIASSAYGITNEQQTQFQKDQTKVGWWKWLGGGKRDTKAAVSQAEYDRLFQQKQAENARAFNSAEAQKSREFSERLSNTAYQRGIADMKKAGLNPALLYGNSGASASTPSSSAASSGSSPGGRTVSPVATSTGQIANLLAIAIGGVIASGGKVAASAAAMSALKARYGRS